MNDVRHGLVWGSHSTEDKAWAAVLHLIDMEHHEAHFPPPAPSDAAPCEDAHVVVPHPLWTRRATRRCRHLGRAGRTMVLQTKELVEQSRALRAKQRALLVAIDAERARLQALLAEAARVLGVADAKAVARQDRRVCLTKPATYTPRQSLP